MRCKLFLSCIYISTTAVSPCCPWSVKSMTNTLLLSGSHKQEVISKNMLRHLWICDDLERMLSTNRWFVVFIAIVFEDIYVLQRKREIIIHSILQASTSVRFFDVTRFCSREKPSSFSPSWMKAWSMKLKSLYVAISHFYVNEFVFLFNLFHIWYGSWVWNIYSRWREGFSRLRTRVA